MTRLLPLSAALALSASPAFAGFTDEAQARGLVIGGSTDGPSIWLDYDDDGVLDILTTSEAGVELYRGDGVGSFSDESDSLSEALRGYTDVRSAIAADFNNDGHLDLAVAIARQAGASRMEIWQGDGQGFPGFSGQPHYHEENGNGYVYGIVAADVNADGWLDLVFGRAVDTPRLFVHLGARSGGFYLYEVGGASHSGYLAVGDLNHDGDPDLVARMSAEFDVQLGASGHAFVTGEEEGWSFDFDASSSDPGGVALCDLNEDSDLDIIRTRGGFDFTSSYAGGGVFLFDRDNNDFLAYGGLSLGNTDLNGVACGDVDNDGDQDLYIAGFEGGLFLGGQDANGAFTLSSMDPISGGGWPETSAHFADFDEDGDQDLLVARNGTTHALLVNDSGGDALRVSMKVDVGAWLDDDCDGGTLRDDIGARARILDPESFAPLTGIRQISGGGGYGGQDPPVMYFGLGNAPAEVKLEYEFAHPAMPDTLSLLVPSALAGPGLVLTTNDIDGDGISNADEGYLDQEDTARWDPDGDGYGAWEDLDSDGDGAPDRVEAGDEDPCSEPWDSDNDGVGDWLDETIQGSGGQDTGDTGGGDDSGTSTPDTGGDDSAVTTDDSAVTADDSAPQVLDSDPPVSMDLTGGLPGCACSAARPLSPGVGWAFALLGGLILRRRRAPS